MLPEQDTSPSSPSTSLQSEVQSVIDKLLDKREDIDTQIDVLRALKDEATLRYERQKIVDTLHQDPFRLGLSTEIPQLRHLLKGLKVTSCHRLLTCEGNSHIQVVVTLLVPSRDEDNDKVEDDTTTGKQQQQQQKHDSQERTSSILQLTFTFERRVLDKGCSTTTQDESDVEGKTAAKDASSKYNCGDRPRKRQRTRRLEKQTHVSYIIQMNENYQKREEIVCIDVWAAGEGPSVESAVPLNEWEDIESNDEENDNDNDNEDNQAHNNGETTEMMSIDEDDDRNDDGGMLEPLENAFPSLDDGRDRFAAHVNPDSLTRFIERLEGYSCSSSMNHSGALFFLMSFPLWEQEWDLLGFLLECVYGEEEEDDEN